MLLLLVLETARAAAAAKTDDDVAEKKHIDWYIGHSWDWHTPNNETPWRESYEASKAFALGSHRDLVDGLFVMTMHLNCGGVTGFLPSDAQQGGPITVGRDAICMCPARPVYLIGNYPYKTGWHGGNNRKRPIGPIVYRAYRSSGLSIGPMNFSWYKPFIDAGIEVWPVFDGHSNCCKSGGAMPGGESCNILAGKRVLAQELLDLALTYNLTGWQQDWEFTDAWVTVVFVVKAHINRVVISFDVVCLTIVRACSSLRCRWNWAGYNETMSFVEETFRVRAARSIHVVQLVCAS